jgi:phosphoribosylformylglycinamidine (FGAM) synthase-like amidotransferase family enzyme
MTAGEGAVSASVTVNVKRPRVLVLAGDGIGSDFEMAQAFLTVGFDAEIRHVNDLIRDRVNTDDLSRRYHAVAIPGGFSFGDQLQGGRILALKLNHGLGWELGRYAERGGLVLGVSNGFQVLVKMGIYGRDLSFTRNQGGEFLNAWVKVSPQAGNCAWLKGLGSLDLPIRHGEGRLVISASRRVEVFGKMQRNGMMCLKYDTNPDGSELDLAGLCDPTGRILGMMPFPEGFLRWTQHPEWTLTPARASAPGQGLGLFENAYREALSAL